jgi:RNA polymerase sigma factor (sigma-70 family)
MGKTEDRLKEEFHAFLRERLKRFFQAKLRGQTDGRGATDVADLVQETLVRLLSAKADPDRDPWPYLAVIGSNLLRDHLRLRARELVTPEPWTAAPEGEPTSPDGPDHPSFERETLLAFYAWGLSQPREIRQVFVLRFVEGRSQRDVAGRLGLSRKAIIKKERGIVDNWRRDVGSAYYAVPQLKKKRIQLKENSVYLKGGRIRRNPDKRPRARTAHR